MDDDMDMIADVDKVVDVDEYSDVAKFLEYVDKLPGNSRDMAVIPNVACWICYF
jgi:hypothetical protein